MNTYVCQVERYSLRCPEVRFRDLQGESSCGPDGSRCAMCKTFHQHASALCGLLDTSGATRTALTSQRLQRCPAVNAIYCAALPNTLSLEQRVRWKQQIKNALCSLLDCQQNRLSCYNCQRFFQGSCVCSSWAATLCSGSKCGSWAQQ